MTKFERCWVYILVILVAVSNLLVLARVRELEGKIAEMRQEEPAEPATVSLRMAQQASAGVGRRELAEPQSMQPVMQSGIFTAYAYCACEKCCGKWAEYGLTASGTVPQEGRTVAVDPDVIPLGSELWIDGEGPFIAEDTGSGINGSTIDVYHQSHAAALEWGKREVTVTWGGSCDEENAK